MTKLIALLAGATLLVAPLSAEAQRHGGMHSSGMHGAGESHAWGGHHSGGFHGDGFHDFHGFHHGFDRDRFFFVGFGLGLFADPWFWGWPGPDYWYSECWYDDPYCDGPGYPPPPPAPPPPPDAAAGPSAQAPATCGMWRWDDSLQKYEWVTSAC